MHISEGVLSPPILASGAILAATGVSIGVKQLKYEDIPFVGILTSAFFIASLIHVPMGPVSVHLILNGLLGVILGWKAFPAILIGLTLQAFLFQFGGITALGVNTLNMALPAVVCYYLFSWIYKRKISPQLFILTGFLCGALPILLAGIMVACSLYLTGQAFFYAAKVIIIAHVPIMIIEGVITASCSLFLSKVKPELLKGAYVCKN